jgi:DNA-binding NtrC family response regulator
VAFAVAALGAAALADARLLPDATFGFVVVAGMIATGALHQIFLVERGHALAGALSGIALAALGVALAYAWFGPLGGMLGVCVEFFVAVSLWLGHLAWLDPHWRSLRRVGIPFLVACAVSFGVGFFFASRLTDVPWRVGVAAAGVGALWWTTFNGARRLGSRLVRTTSGRLADAVHTAGKALTAGATLEEIAVRSLGPLSKVFQQDDAQPELFTLEPPLRIRLDVANRASIRSADAPFAIAKAVFGGRETGALDLSSLRSQVVRNPGVRSVVEAMESGGTGAVVPCSHLDHVEALLLLPIGDRTEPLSRIELEALGRLSELLGGALSAALAQRRAETHIHDLAALRRDAEDRVAALEGELEQLRGQFDVLGRGLAEHQTLHVAYSPSMRRVQTRAIELAPSSRPILLIATAGAPVLPISRFIHDRGPRWEGPFVVADCSSETPELVMSLLFGSEKDHRRGWLRSAAGGTLLLRDLPALPSPAQSLLATALVAQGADSLDVRLIATARTPLSDLERRGALDRSLADVFSGCDLTIPSLRDRREDVPSLILLAIARACRVLATEPVGIEQAAMAALVAHDWPGDVAELESTVELAVSRAQGNSIHLADLPPLGWPVGGEDDSLRGTYFEVERRLLERALLRAGGNKSQAARMLGLKRTTFLDKLRRHRLEKQTPDSMSGSAVG